MADACPESTDDDLPTDSWLHTNGNGLGLDLHSSELSDSTSEAAMAVKETEPTAEQHVDQSVSPPSMMGHLILEEHSHNKTISEKPPGSELGVAKEPGVHQLLNENHEVRNHLVGEESTLNHNTTQEPVVDHQSHKGNILEALALMPAVNKNAAGSEEPAVSQPMVEEPAMDEHVASETPAGQEVVESPMLQQLLRGIAEEVTAQLLSAGSETRNQHRVNESGSILEASLTEAVQSPAAEELPTEQVTSPSPAMNLDAADDAGDGPVAPNTMTEQMDLDESTEGQPETESSSEQSPKKQNLSPSSKRKRKHAPPKPAVGILEKRLRTAPATAPPASPSNSLPLSPPEQANPIPRFIPTLLPPLSLNLHIPEGGYSCQACGDQFLIEASLAFHLNRKSVQLTLTCPCDAPQIFYNKCAMNAHLREHEGAVLGPNPVEEVPLPVELLDLAPPPPTEMDDCGHAVAILGYPPLRKKPLTCTECAADFKSDAEYKEHFGSGPAQQCDRCDLQASSECAMSAHQRLHLRKEPFVCPDCGRHFVSWTALTIHLQWSCFHQYRKYHHTCPLCGNAFDTRDLVCRHVITAHTRTHFRCGECPIAFGGKSAADAHRREAHESRAVMKQMRKCPFCECVFYDTTKCVEHVSEHVSVKALVQVVYQCSECDSTFMSRDTFGVHITQCTGQESAAPSTAPEAQVMPQADSDPMTLKCERCARTFGSRRGLTLHEAHCRGTPEKSQCKACQQFFPGFKALVNHGQKHLEDGLKVCLFCSNEVITPTDFASHVQKHISDIKVPTTCFVCRCDLQTEDVKEQHLRSEHSLLGYSCTDCPMSYPTSFRLGRHQQIMHRDDPGSSHPYICWMCQERDFSKRVSLRHHLVTTHKIPLADIDFLKMPTHRMKSKAAAAYGRGGVASESPGTSGTTPRAGSTLKMETSKVGSPSKKGAMPKTSNTPKSATGTPKSSSNNSKSDDTLQSTSVSSPKNSGKATPKKQQKAGTSASTSKMTPTKKEVKQESKALHAKHRCAKCGFQTQSTLQFRSHIDTHKPNPKALQCDHCGLCFAVKPSLKRHLFLQHQIRWQPTSGNEEEEEDDQEQTNGDIMSLFYNEARSEAEDSPAEEAKLPEALPPALEPNQCSVCRERFTCELDLTKHFRCHGMAFLLMKRRGGNNCSKPEEEAGEFQRGEDMETEIDASQAGKEENGQVEEGKE